MKKYNNSFPEYGQSITSRIVYHQKMGVAKGIVDMLKSEIRSKGLELKNWIKKYQFNNTEINELCVTVIIPTQEDDWLHGKCPTFRYGDKFGLIDMLHFDTHELSFHIMMYDRETKSYKNGFWHTVREGLNLEQTCTLFEYVDDVVKTLVILPVSEHDKYYKTGALGVNL